MWKLECPPKVKHFLWRMSHNTLAIKRVLKHRGVKTDTICGMCNRLDEDGGHLFFKCKEVKVAWRELNLDGVRCSLMAANSARGVMESILGLRGKEQLTVIMFLSMWWDERNKRREEGRSRSPTEVANLAAIICCKHSETTETLAVVGKWSESTLEKAT